MRLTSKGRYGVSAMVDLHKHEAEHHPVALAEISERQFISLSYLDQLFRALRSGGLVRSIRGPGGGYLLTRPATEISVADVIRAVNEPIRTTMCENAIRGCHRGKRCDTHQLWEAMGQYIYRFLDAVTIEMVCEKKVVLDELLFAPMEEYMLKPVEMKEVVMKTQ